MSDERITPQIELDERRGDARYPCNETAHCFAPVTGMNFEASVKNVSRTGVGIVSDWAIAADAPVILLVPETGQNPGMKLQARVVHCLRYAGDSWFAGCRFDRSLTEEELRLLLIHWS